ncbi:peroxiredoxin [Kosakonia quasisacchari]|uniref:Peroxiredoxin n=1 Tax=Kosakonia quasisacchari TaxID=2529380 RepID=A0A4R0HWC6_9ENTR|nr:peroxiredoxin [Kosakonia quasisacchari]
MLAVKMPQKRGRVQGFYRAESKKCNGDCRMLKKEYV